MKFSATDTAQLRTLCRDGAKVLPEIDNAKLRQISASMLTSLGQWREEWFRGDVLTFVEVAAELAPTKRIGRLLDRLEAKRRKADSVGFNPLLVIAIASLFVQIIRLWVEWRRKKGNE